MGLIVVEGFDNTGKSTLIKKLWDEAPRRTWLLASQKCKDALETRQRMQTIIEICKTSLFGPYIFNILMDRTHVVSEEIYGRVIRNKSLFEQFWEVYWKVFLDLKPTFIYCRPSRDAIIGTLTQRDQMQGVDEHSDKLITAYDKFFADAIEREELRMLDNVIPYSYEADPDASKLIHVLKERGLILP